MNLKGKRVETICAKCGEVFQHYPSDTRKFCSTKCAGNARKRIEKTCLYCGEIFEVHKHRKETAKWCSYPCYNGYRQLYPQFQPGWKGESIENPLILNRPKPKMIINRRKAERKGRRKLGKTYDCIDCGKPYVLKAPKQKRCKDCSYSLSRGKRSYRKKRKRRLENDEFIVGYSKRECEECDQLFVPNGWNEVLCDGCKTKRDGAGSKLLPPQPCEVCGWEHTVARHRIKPGKDGGTYIPENVMFLCPNHHVAIHAGLAVIIPDREYNWIGSAK